MSANMQSVQGDALGMWVQTQQTPCDGHIAVFKLGYYTNAYAFGQILRKTLS